MQFLLLLPLLVSLTSANIMNNVLFKVLTQGMDPLSRTVWKSSLGPEFFESDSSSSASAGPMASYATDAISDLIVQSMFNPQVQRPQGPSQWRPSPPQHAFSHSSPNFAYSNVVSPSARDPSKNSNLVNPYNAAPFALDPSGNNVMSPAATMPTGLAVTNPSSTASSNTGDSGPVQTSFSSGNSGLGGSLSSSSSSSSANMGPTQQNNIFEYFMMLRFFQMLELF